MTPTALPVETVQVAALKPHPRNYQSHPDDQIEHLMASIREHGMYRNVVVARDDTVLAGHGVLLAVKRLGLTEIPVVRVDLDPDEPRALKIMTGDNEISHLAARDDRRLTELLKEISDAVDIDGLLGTGYDQAMLANLVMVTRPQSEIADFDAAAHWVGMPEYERGGDGLVILVRFRTEAARVDFAAKLEIPLPSTSERGKSIWWPAEAKMTDRQSARFVPTGDAAS